MKTPLIFYSFVVLFLVANLYVFYRLWHLMPPNTVGRVIMSVLCAVSLCSVFLYFLVGEKTSYWFGSALYRVGTSWVMIFLYILLAFLLMDIFRSARIVPMKWMLEGSWTVFGIFTVSIAVLMTIGNIVYNNKKRTELDIVVNKDMSGLPSVKIVAVSDLHLGYGIGNKEFSRWIELINKENPDVVLMVGDIIDTYLKPLYDKNMADTFKSIESKYGIFAVPGNHEYIGGIDESMEFMRSAGVTVLRDSAVLIGDALYVMGRDDRMKQNRAFLENMVSRIDMEKPVILMDHQPLANDETVQAGIDMQISGHTHYGQMWPISWITKAKFENPYGYMRKGNTDFYTTSGIGIWGGKFRIGSRSEYVVINLSGGSVSEHEAETAEEV